MGMGAPAWSDAKAGFGAPFGLRAEVIRAGKGRVGAVTARKVARSTRRVGTDDARA